MRASQGKPGGDVLLIVLALLCVSAVPIQHFAANLIEQRRRRGREVRGFA